MIFKEAQIRLSASRGAQWTHPAGSTHHGGSKKCPLAIKHGNGKLPIDTIDALDILMYIYRGFPIAMFENRRLQEFVSGRIYIAIFIAADSTYQPTVLGVLKNI